MNILFFHLKFLFLFINFKIRVVFVSFNQYNCLANCLANLILNVLKLCSAIIYFTRNNYST